jgi:hypothetical protein
MMRSLISGSNADKNYAAISVAMMEMMILYCSEMEGGKMKPSLENEFLVE